MQPSLLILVRHGRTAGNRAGPGTPMSGWTDTPLDAQGRHEAEALGRRLAAGPAFDAVYASPLSRAIETAQIAAGAWGPVRPHDGLREISCGDVDGAPMEDVKARHAALWEANLRQDDDDFRWPGGESYRELRARCLAAVCSIAAAHPGQRVLVVTHAGVIGQILGALHGIPPARWEAFRPGNASLTAVSWQGERGVLLRFGDREHLDGRERVSSSTRPPDG
ncbi:histidine phosphatase family protein [Sorangium sp. So ce176]|uniref:histidine phosphatase family protein n=1 Tax=Sorangium sp. So ce176 TaxID=3133286 RepID=UPI003F63DF27